ncbi:putative Ig domain-containing protein [Chloroflexi bacterium TSY]|nr:putative Ig domain-containing protein [Chloroflexi bacterium TSY]
MTSGVVNQVYSYDMEATGNPAPTYSLISPPAGMIIDTNSGLISWTPAMTGTFPVTVVATNGQGRIRRPLT